jgi:hypothetical protein
MDPFGQNGRQIGTFVFIYFTEAKNKEMKGKDHCPRESFPH